MEEPALLELIDQYLMGNIRPEDKTELERMMANDPETAALVRESRKAFKVLQAARDSQLREKLKAIDRDDTHRSGRISHKIIVMICLLVIIGGSWYWASHYFSNKAIAVRYFNMPNSPDLEIDLHGELKTIWEEAEDAFISEDYGRASNLYNSILKSPEMPVLYLARWNLLLSDLALHGQSIGWKQAVETFANETPAPYGIRAQRLLRLLNSGGYKFIATCTQVDISGLKPRLI